MSETALLDFYWVKVENVRPELTRRYLAVGRDTDDARRSATPLEDESVSAYQVNGFDNLRFSYWIKKTPTLRELRDFYVTMSKLQTSGMPLNLSLEMTLPIVGNPHFRYAIVGLIHEIRTNGRTLADSMLLFPHVFAQEQVAMVRAGEESGELSQVLERMSMFYDKNTAIMSRLRNALIYPAVIGTAAFGVMIFVSIKFIPQIKDLYAQFRAPLPWPTLAVDFVSGFIRRQPWLWGFIGFGIYRFIKYWPTFYAKQAVQRFFVSKTGPLGDLILRLFIARALRSVAMLLNAGVPVQDAYRLAAAITTYVDFQVMFISLRQDILAGVSIFRSINRYRHYFRKHGFYIASYIRMAEQGGEVGIVMARLAEYYEREVDARMANIDKLVEPITVIFLGAAICFLLISVYYPIFALASYVIPGVKH